MLCLKRKNQESIIIGDDIKVTVLETNDKFVRLGVQAPSDVSIHRQEVYAAIQSKEENGGQGTRH